jgi:hypothetical protein
MLFNITYEIFLPYMEDLMMKVTMKDETYELYDLIDIGRTETWENVEATEIKIFYLQKTFSYADDMIFSF